ncbi:MAG: hypothetical protein WC764_04820, partial [Candidatus Paceibacterota bacterium]
MSDQQAPPEVNEVPAYNLFFKEIRPIYNWHEWLLRWKIASSFEEMLGLLHVGFNVCMSKSRYDEPEYTYIDRLIFYLGMADGWRDASHFRSFGDTEPGYRILNSSSGQYVLKSESGLRQHLAQKAFDVLALNFFSWGLKGGGRDGDEFGSGWVEGVASPRLLDAIQFFFRAVKHRSGNSVGAPNLPNFRDRKHTEKIAFDFLMNLTKFIWGYEGENISGWDTREHKDAAAVTCDEKRVRLDAVKPWLIEVLSELRSLDVLREWMLVLDEPCLAQLKEIAMRNELRHYAGGLVLEDRLVASVEEACLVGSRAAWFLKEHEVMKRERDRLCAIREAER